MANTWMVYYSFEGNTAFVAEELARHLPMTVQRLRVEKEPPKKGLGKFLHGGKSALTGEDPGLLPLEKVPEDAENLILAYPVWAGTYPPAIAAFLKTTDLTGKKVYVIACSASGKGDGSVEKLREQLGGATLGGSLNLISPLKNPEQTAEKLKEFAGTIG